MALKATIFKAQVQVTDMERHFYDALDLTIARHPSETDERMMIRLLAFALNAHEQLQFTKGLCADDEPDLWQLSLADEIDVWIDLGLPDERRIRKACGRAKAVKIYGYGAGSFDSWWSKIQPSLGRFNHLQVIQLPQDQLAGLTAMATRNMQLQVTVDQGEVLITDENNAVTITPRLLFPT